MDIFQVGILGVVGVLFLVKLKQEKAEFAIYLCVFLSIFIFLGILEQLEILIDAIREVGTFINIEKTYIGTLIKMLGITYLAEFSSGICKDAGYQALATQIEIFAKITISVLSLPILLALLRTIREFLT
jgi:stage III sporulation protein AD